MFEACTVTVPVPVVLLYPHGLGEVAMTGVKSGGGGAACVTVNVSPAITRVPVRAGPLTFGVAVNVTDAGPAPLVGATLSQLANDCAVQAHVGSVPMTI